MKITSLLLSLLFVGVASARRTGRSAAFATPRASSWVGGKSSSAVAAAPRARGSTAVSMVDLNVVIGVGVGLAGLGGGVGLVWWTERAGTIAEERGSDAMSEETKNRMAGMFMEDVEMSAGLVSSRKAAERQMNMPPSGSLVSSGH